jgi:hypothetical protein
MGNTASIGGTVRDSSGAVVPGAQVSITQTDTNFSQSKESAGDGSFLFPVLPVGPYRLEVKKEGFGTYRQTGIVLTVNQIAQIPVTLAPKAQKEVITVTAAASPVNTTTGALSSLVDRRQLEGLPLNGRNPAELVLLSPGVANILLNPDSSIPALPLQWNYPAGIGVSGISSGALTPNVNGMRPGGVYFSLDGANNLDSWGVIGGPFPNPDAVQEFSVLTSGYGADYISAPGGVVNVVTKSGTNAFHGDVFEFLRNGVLNARNYFAANQDNIKRNQFGVTAGGPIRKDKFFIFGSYQGTTYRSSAGGDIQYVPTNAQRAGDFSATPVPLHNPWSYNPANPMDPSAWHFYPNNQIPTSDFSPVTAQVLAGLPHSSAPDGRIEVVHPTAQTEHQVTVKADYVLGKHSFVARYFLSDYKQPAVDSATNWLTTAGGNNIRWQDVMLGHNYASGQWVNEFRLTFQRKNFVGLDGRLPSFADMGVAMTPAPTSKGFQLLMVQGYFMIPNGTINQWPNESYNFSDSLKLVRGRHQLSLGAEVSRLRTTERNGQLQPGVVMWAPVGNAPFLSGSQMSDFVLGKVTVFMQGDGLMARAAGTLWGFHIDDQLRVTSRLNLTLGLRWDPYWPFHALHGRMSCWIPGEKSTVFTNAPLGVVFPGDPGCNASGTQPDLNTFQPRVGFAYRLDQKGHTSIRAGYGMFTSQFPLMSFLNSAQINPYVRNIGRMLPYSIAYPWLGTPPFTPGQPGGDPFAAGFHANDAPLPSNTPFTVPMSLSAFAQDFKLGNLQKWNLTLEHMFRGNTVVRASYVGSKGTHLSLGRQANAAVYIPGNCGDPPLPCSSQTNVDQRRPYYASGLGSITIGESNGNSSYNAFQFSVERRVATGLTFTSNYTWSKSIDITSQNANGTLSGSFNSAVNPENLNAYRGPSDYDLSHSLASTVMWQSPSFAKRNNLFLKRVLGGWQVSGIWMWQVGMPFTVYTGGSNDLRGAGPDHADLVAGKSPSLDPNRPRGQVVAEYFNTAAFTQNALGTFGNSPRNFLRGPGFNNVDLGIMKEFPIKGEKYHLMFRAEFFNVSNTPHFGGLQTSMNQPRYGALQGARDPRIIQFALKFNW